MKFDLHATLELSKELDKSAKTKLGGWFSEANKTLLRKGAADPKGAAEVTDWSLEKNKILVHIVSGRRVRAHDALLRLRNHLSGLMGKEYKVGVRSLAIKSYLIEVELESKLETELNLPFTKKIEAKDKRVLVELEAVDEAFLRDGSVDRLINLIQEKIDRQSWGGKADHMELIWKSPEKKPVWTGDPTPVMMGQGWVKRILPGEWYHGPSATRVMKAMEEICIEELIEPLGFDEVIIPKLVPFDVWLRTGHMPGAAPEFFYVSKPKTRNPEYWEDFIDQVKVTRQVPLDLLKEKIEDPLGGMCYAQCLPLYWAFENALIEDDSLPIKYFDRSGTSYRWEAGGLHGIERDTEFHRIEVVWFGSKDQAIEIKEKILEKYKHIFNDILDVEWRMNWVTPWYMAQAGEHEEALSKESGTIDFEGWLPWKGSRKESEWLEFQNLTVAGTKFSDAWKFKSRKGEVWTGCTGIGLERWLALFLAQKGMDPEKWPKKFRKRVGKLPDEPRMQRV